MKNILLALTLTASSAFAQQPPTQAAAPKIDVDSRFSAWLGCWRLDDDLSGTGARMCVTPEKSGVRLQTIAGTQRGIDEIVIPDGKPHAIVDSECKGTEQAEFSKDGARLFRTTDVTCGKEAPRTIKSVIFMAAGPAWVNVQYVSGAAANTSVRVQRYRRSADQKLADGSRAQQPDAQAARLTTLESTTWSIDDVIEANGKLPAEALQAALTEVRHRFDLNKKTLIALDEAGVHDQVIDLMIALTYPQRFVVQRAGAPSAPTGVLSGGGWFDPLLSPMISTTMLDCYSPFGYGYRSYYSMCGSSLYNYGLYDAYYGYYGARNYGYGYYGWVDVGAFPGGNNNIGTIEPQAQGRVVNGRGYTQIRDRTPEPTVPRVSGGNNGGGWSGSGSGVSSSGGYSSGSSSSGSSGGGGGSSSSGDSGARVAVPKGGGQ
jgi:hypothetical protein